MLYIYAIRQVTAGFSNVKAITLSTLESVNLVGRLEVRMGSYGVGECTRASE